MQLPLASIPSPPTGVWHLWFIPIRGYALMIIIGVITAVWWTERRWVARGGQSGVAVDVAVWAVPFGLIGGRIYHVITDWELYFGEAGRPLDVFMIWKGGLGIWGAIALGALGAYIACRSRGISLRAFADAAAPGIVLAQGIGRWGNWFNQELFGAPTSLPWGLEIDPDRVGAIPGESTYHPTFLYEFLWCLGVVVLLLWAERRFSLGYGRVFALYVAAYTVGRFWIELLRIDPAHEVMGLRLNNWTSVVVFLGAAGYLYLYRGRTTALETPTTAPDRVPAGVAAAGAAGAVVAGAVAAEVVDEVGDALEAQEVDEATIDAPATATDWEPDAGDESYTDADAAEDAAEKATEEPADDEAYEAYESDDPYEPVSGYDDTEAAFDGAEAYAAEESFDAGDGTEYDTGDQDDAGYEAPMSGEPDEAGDAEFAAETEDADHAGYESGEDVAAHEPDAGDAAAGGDAEAEGVGDGRER